MVRELLNSDIPLMLPNHIAASNRREGQQINARRELLTQNIGTPFVAIDQSSGRPCFIQWAFDYSHNDFIARFFKGRFPSLYGGQILLENAYTHPDYRGQGVMGVAMSRIADLLATHGAIEVMTFVESTNVASLKGCIRAGFAPFVTRKDLSLCGGLKRYRVFEPIAPNTSLDFSKSPVSLRETADPGSREL
jgi:GNAT superfamily N-acetyltransferase